MMNALQGIAGGFTLGCAVYSHIDGTIAGLVGLASLFLVEKVFGDEA